MFAAQGRRAGVSEKGRKPMSRQKVGTVIVGLAAVSLLAGCREHVLEAAKPPGPVRFRIEEQGAVKRGDGETRIWQAIHEMEGKTTRFQIKLTLKPPKPGQPLAFTSG